MYIIRLYVYIQVVIITEGHTFTSLSSSTLKNG